MNDEHVAALNSFVKVHGSKLKKNASNGERCAYLVRYSESGIPLNLELNQDFRFTRQEIVDRFDRTSTPIRWLLQQVTSYDQDTSHVIGLIFDSQTVYAHVVTKGMRM